LESRVVPFSKRLGRDSIGTGKVPNSLRNNVGQRNNLIIRESNSSGEMNHVKDTVHQKTKKHETKSKNTYLEEIFRNAGFEVNLEKRKKKPKFNRFFHTGTIN